MKKIYISQPMRGRSTDAIIAERKALVADEVEVLDTYLNGYTNKPPLHLLALALEKMADADAVIFAPGWRNARGCRVEHLAASEYGISIIHAKG